MNSFQIRTLIFYTISMILFAILIGRFFYLQIYKGEEIYEEARSIKTRIKLYPRREERYILQMKFWLQQT